MNKLITKSILLGGLLMACREEYPFETPRFPDEVTVFDILNSRYDDMNSDLNYLTTNQFEITYSSNSGSSGQNFSFINEEISINWDKRTGRLSLDKRDQNFITVRTTKEFMYQVNTQDCDEKGPYTYSASEESLILLYCSENRIPEFV